MTKKKTDTQQTGNRKELLSSGKDYLLKPSSERYTWLSNVELPKSCKGKMPTILSLIHSHAKVLVRAVRQGGEGWGEKKEHKNCKERNKTITFTSYNCIIY